MVISLLFFTIDTFINNPYPRTTTKNSLQKLQYFAFQVYFILVLPERANKNLNMDNKFFQITEKYTTIF